MKTISKFFGVVAAIAALAACNKDLATDNTDIPEVNHPTGTNELTITVNQPATKVTMENVSGNLNWEDNESIAVVFVDGGVYEFAKEGAVSGGKASFVGKNLPDAYTLDDIRDIYYPYNDEYSTAEQYANHKVSTTQNNMKADQAGNFDMKDLPLHWHGDEGVPAEGVELAAYNVAIIKARSLSFTPNTDANGYMSILFKGVRNDLYKVKINSGEDLVFKVYVNGEDDALYPVFIVNYNTSDSCILNPLSTTATPTPVLPGKRYKIEPTAAEIFGQIQFYSPEHIPNCEEITFELGVSVIPANAILFTDKKDAWYIYDTEADHVTVQTPYGGFWVESYANMFMGRTKLKKINNLEKISARVEEPSGMFDGCSALEEFTFPFNCAYCNHFHTMFCNCSSLKTLDLSALCTWDGTDYSYMFYNCSSLTDLILSKDFYVPYWYNPSINVNNMFAGAGVKDPDLWQFNGCINVWGMPDNEYDMLNYVAGVSGGVYLKRP